MGEVVKKKAKVQKVQETKNAIYIPVDVSGIDVFQLYDIGPESYIEDLRSALYTDGDYENLFVIHGNMETYPEYAVAVYDTGYTKYVPITLEEIQEYNNGDSRHIWETVCKRYALN